MDMSVRARDLPDPPLDAAADRPDGSWVSTGSKLNALILVSVLLR